VNFTVFGMSRTGDAPIYHGQYLAPCDQITGLGPYLCNGSVPKPAPGINPNTIALTNIAQNENFSNEGAILRVEQGIGSSKLTMGFRAITSFPILRSHTRRRLRNFDSLQTPLSA
jgi:hypothetical protein